MKHRLPSRAPVTSGPPTDAVPPTVTGLPGPPVPRNEAAHPTPWGTIDSARTRFDAAADHAGSRTAPPTVTGLHGPPTRPNKTAH
ncbi:hypothetical protein ACFFNX_28015, partial [Actinoallomurus acaciae]